MPTHKIRDVSIDITLRQCRLARGMTQRELATRAGVTRQTVMNVESGRNQPSILLLYRFADILGVRVTDLFHI